MEIEYSAEGYLMCLSKVRGGIIIMINGVCSYCGPNTEYENDDEPLVIDIP